MAQSRRDFIRHTVAAGAAACAAHPLFAAPKRATGDIKAFLLHLGTNMWCDWTPPGAAPLKTAVPATKLRLNEAKWRESTAYAAQKGMNLLLVDVGEALVYPSHPELAIEGSWSPERLRAEIKRLEGLGFEVIPKVNFSNTHNGWLKHYRRLVSTSKYYQVCADVIKDVAEAFDHPRFIHLGYDEETYGHQSKYDYVVVRQGELWWHDFLWFVKTTEATGARPWIWSDYGWHHPDFVKRCPKSVMHSNWYYDEDLGGMSLDKKKNRYWNILQLYIDLEKAGFDQIPCGSNWLSGRHKAAKRTVNDSIKPLVKFCREHIAPERLKGFMMAPWEHCETDKNVAFIRASADLFVEALNG